MQDRTITDLTLLLLYLTSWEEQVHADRLVHHAWRGHRFDVLDALQEAGYLNLPRRGESLILTKIGVEQARVLAASYLVTPLRSSEATECQEEGSDELAASERAFLRQRLTLVERWLANPDTSKYDTVERGRVRRSPQPTRWQEVTYRREARLLGKLLARAREGQALTSLKAWRRHLGEYLRRHRQRYRAMQDAYDAWWRLPQAERGGVPRLPKPPSARSQDYEGAPWIVDDRLLALLDDLAERLQKWLGSA